MESSFNTSMRLVRSEDLLGRFRSKLDLYKYLTQQLNLFLPPLGQIKIAFLRAILSNQKQALRLNQVNRMTVPHFQELSVKNLYQDVMTDQVVSQYLPDLCQNSGKLPDRDFFFGILGTIKNDYLRQIIDHATQVRQQGGDQNNQADAIQISDQWLDELMKHPFVSKKPGKAIYLMKQKSKVVREKQPHKQFEVAKRLYPQEFSQLEVQSINPNISKRRKGNDGPQIQMIAQKGTPNKNMTMTMI